ncbi:hypothetical protein POVCU1_002370 [Plasmodium ovale curtisi]|uniref:Uncharacterized protein n=1 Tax=Plasmodium ovale curtisi TaxID=864141 RepID=A0A1A8VJK8_PLAOA|nr:hypothetical protein POVCU1_002370 [Plasmodium ovale curtisi]
MVAVSCTSMCVENERNVMTTSDKIERGAKNALDGNISQCRMLLFVALSIDKTGGHNELTYSRRDEKANGKNRKVQKRLIKCRLRKRKKIHATAKGRCYGCNPTVVKESFEGSKGGGRKREKIKGRHCEVE